MKFMRNQLIPTILVALLSTFSFASAQAAESTDKFSLGYHFTTQTSGLSGQMEFSDKVTAQAIIGFVGDVSNYSLRGRYHLATDKKWDAYAFASIGLFTWEESGFAGENELSIGGGVGMEYDWQNLDAGFPPITWSFEIEMNSAEFDNYDFSKFSLGIAAHYRF